MTDPLSIFAIVEGASGLALICIGVAKTLNDIALEYKHSKISVLSMIQNLEIVRLAWERIKIWYRTCTELNQFEAHYEEDDGLFKRPQIPLDVGLLVMEALEDDLSPFRNQDFGLRGKAQVIWNETAL